jgi:hypothetical protein
MTSETRFPSAGMTVLASVLATAILIAVGAVFSFGTRALVMSAWKIDVLRGWLPLGLNLITHVVAIVLAVILMKRFSGRRAALARWTIVLMIGYAVIVFFVALFHQIGTRILVVLSNATQASLPLLSFTVWVGVPVAIAITVLFFAGRTSHSTRS